MSRPVDSENPFRPLAAPGRTDLSRCGFLAGITGGQLAKAMRCRPPGKDGRVFQSTIES